MNSKLKYFTSVAALGVSLFLSPIASKAKDVNLVNYFNSPVEVSLSNVRGNEINHIDSFDIPSQSVRNYSGINNQGTLCAVFSNKSTGGSYLECNDLEKPLLLPMSPYGESLFKLITSEGNLRHSSLEKAIDEELLDRNYEISTGDGESYEVCDGSYPFLGYVSGTNTTNNEFPFYLVTLEVGSNGKYSIKEIAEGSSVNIGERIFFDKPAPNSQKDYLTFVSDLVPGSQGEGNNYSVICTKSSKDDDDDDDDGGYDDGGYDGGGDDDDDDGGGNIT